MARDVDEKEQIYSPGQHKPALFRRRDPACGVPIPKDAMAGVVTLCLGRNWDHGEFLRENMSGESFQGK
jgi:hypothetical protein